ncbi:hypothetical protein D9757_008191 [Collybiopsis confluens]|uniref:peptidylprolyl isomerase n=1 Tax=Collybiopsis confluens TaxID=2823264 RepID=A0A8H5M4D0_9AGAR|nr:hypothetical protein D9757_008191 [Collybiopsis confluens]
MQFEAIKAQFFRSPSFAVVGASKDQSKYGTRVLRWYLQRELPVTPVHPKETELEGVATIKSVNELSSPTTTSVSIITPSKVTLDILKAAKELRVPALWIQPGAEDPAVIEYIKDPANGLVDKVIYGGDCVLVDGDGIRANLFFPSLLHTSTQTMRIHTWVLSLLSVAAIPALAQDAAYEAPTELVIETTHMPDQCTTKAAKGDSIKVHYTGTLHTTGKKFDSSHDRNAPLPLKLGVGQVIKGWDEGLEGMCVGEKRKLTIPADKAYGSRGFGNLIPANSALVFETELVELQSAARDEL